MHFRLVPSLLAASLTLTAVPAGATSCYEPGTDWSEAGLSLLPEDGAVGVPVNSLIWIGCMGVREYVIDDAPPLVTLSDGVGEPIVLSEAMRLSGGPMATWIGFAPPDELRPDTEWTMSVTVGSWDPEGDWEDDRITATAGFTSGDTADHESPQPPIESSRYLESGGVGFDGPCADSGPADFAIFRLTRIDALSLVGIGDDPDATVTAGKAGRVSVNTTLAPGSRQTFRFAAVDLAGNVSEWSDPVQARMPLAGCNRQEGADDEISIALLLLCLGFRRSRRRLKDLGEEPRADRPRRRGFGLALVLGTALLTAAVAPAPALADDSTGHTLIDVTQSAAERSLATTGATAAAPKTVPTWAASWDRRLRTEARVMGGMTLGGGAASLGIGLALPFRPPSGLSLLTGSVVGWGPTLGGLLTVTAIRARLRAGITISRLVTELTVGFVVSAVTTGLAFTAGLSVGFFLAVMTGDGGLLVASMAAPAAVLVSNVAIGINLGRAKRVQAGGAAIRSRPQPRVTAAGPLGIVVQF